MTSESEEAIEARRKETYYQSLTVNKRIRIILLESIRILKERGWCRGYKGPYGEVCVLHATGIAANNLFGRPYYGETNDYLRDKLETRVAGWNDSPKQTRGNIIITLARLAREIT